MSSDTSIERFAPETPLLPCEGAGDNPKCDHSNAISWGWMGHCPKGDNLHARCNDCHREYCFNPVVEYICAECMTIRSRSVFMFQKPSETDTPDAHLLAFCGGDRDCFGVHSEDDDL